MPGAGPPPRPTPSAPPKPAPSKAAPAGRRAPVEPEVVTPPEAEVSRRRRSSATGWARRAPRSCARSPVRGRDAHRRRDLGRARGDAAARRRRLPTTDAPPRRRAGPGPEPSGSPTPTRSSTLLHAELVALLDDERRPRAQSPPPANRTCGCSWASTAWARPRPSPRSRSARPTTVTRVVLAAADTFRAAAAEQLTHWAERVGAELVRGQEGADPGSVVFDAMSAAPSRGADLVLVDTAGRLHTKVNLMDELEKLRRIVERTPGALKEVLLVLDATTGQNGLTQAAPVRGRGRRHRRRAHQARRHRQGRHRARDRGRARHPGEAGRGGRVAPPTSSRSSPRVRRRAARRLTARVWRRALVVA